LHLVVAVSGFGAVAVDQKAGQDHEGQQLEEFGLPVLQGAGPELPEEVADLQRLIMFLLLVGPGEPLGHQLTNPGRKEQPGQGDAQAVIPPSALHPISTLSRRREARTDYPAAG
jgi:hypothetical protein